MAAKRRKRRKENHRPKSGTLFGAISCQLSAVGYQLSMSAVWRSKQSLRQDFVLANNCRGVHRAAYSLQLAAYRSPKAESRKLTADCFAISSKKLTTLVSVPTSYVFDDENPACYPFLYGGPFRHGATGADGL